MDYWIDLFEREGIPCGKINSVEEALESEQASDNGMVIEVEHETSGNIKMLGIPFSFSNTPVGIKLSPPLLGEHTKEILKSLVHLDDREIDMLSKDGVI